MPSACCARSAIVRSCAAVQITEFGGPEVLTLVDLPEPTPAEGQLLVLAGDGDGTAPSSVTQAELASMVSGARQTVNQALRSLESRGYIRADGRGFEILDRVRLEHLAER